MAKESTFEDKFPSLKNLNYNALKDPITRGQWWFWSKDILDNCLDKQTVREAIDKNKFTIEDYGFYSVVIVDDLIKELGL